MIPILYEKTELDFTSNGLGRLPDCISAVVTEERNGVYELEFQYPTNGYNYEQIKPGRIVGVTHDDTGDIQPFDIVSYEKPIDGVVTFHAVHVSYRQSYLTVTGSGISSIEDAFSLLKDNSTPDNIFTYWTNKTSSAYLSAANGVPKTVRSMLGGVEGSILDIYGGEYEWDKFVVKLYDARGENKDFTIRYGVNLLDYNENYDISETYISCVPYWTNGTETVVGDAQTLSGYTVTERGECAPMDVSDRFESKPTKAEVEAMGLTVLRSKNPTAPAQNITVSFIRLQDTDEFAQFADLLQCKLCDTVNVLFPDYDFPLQFKIVKTVWDVLLERYTEMELGTLSTTLADALGISQFGSQQATARQADAVYETGTINGWHYRRWSSGKVEAWASLSFSSASWSVWASPVRYMDKSITIPAGIFSSAPNIIATSPSNQYWVVGATASSATSITLRLATVASSAMATAVKIYAYTN